MKDIKEALKDLVVRIIDFISKLFSVKIVLFFVPVLIIFFLTDKIPWWGLIISGAIVFLTREIYKIIMKHGYPQIPDGK